MRITSPRGLAGEKAGVVSFLLTCLVLSKIILCMGKKIKNSNAQALGSLGGKARAKNLSDAKLTEIASKGGNARAAKLSANERRRIAKLAVAARENKRKEGN